MSAGERPVSEDELHLFVDGRLPGDQRERIARFLEGNPAARARVAAWRDDGDRLRRALAPKAREPIPPALDVQRLAAARAARRWTVREVAAAFCVATLLGMGAGWWLRGSDAPHGLAALAQQAALAQRVFEAGRLKMEFDRTEPVQYVGEGGPEPGRAIRAPDLSASGCALLGGRVVATEQGTAVLFVYEDPALGRVGLFVRLMVGLDLDAAMRPVSASGVSGFVWSRHGVGFGLVANGLGPGLNSLSGAVRGATDAELRKEPDSGTGANRS